MNVANRIAVFLLFPAMRRLYAQSGVAGSFPDESLAPPSLCQVRSDTIFLSMAIRSMQESAGAIFAHHSILSNADVAPNQLA
jgi:hypothetical protein